MVNRVLHASCWWVDGKPRLKRRNFLNYVVSNVVIMFPHLASKLSQDKVVPYEKILQVILFLKFLRCTNSSLNVVELFSKCATVLNCKG